MTTRKAPATAMQAKIPLPFPDPPERLPEDMTTFRHLGLNGLAHALALHLGNPESVVVGGDLYLSPHPTRDMTGLTFPDLTVAFGADPEAYFRSNAYIISEQGKPPDMVLEIASPSTAHHDRGRKRQIYAGLSIPEYWRFDPAGAQQRTRLAGDRLVDGQYQPIPVKRLEDGVLQGYSEMLNLYLRWDQGELRFHDPATGRHILTYEDQRARADQAEQRARELEEELRRLRGNLPPA